MSTITFTSDFGTSDWFTAAVKGEILKVASDVRIVDITHDIAPFDIRSAAFLLYAVYSNYPEGTVHLAVIDPGVGGQRKPLIVDSCGHYFVGPDNGLFSYLFTAEPAVFTINVSEATSSTFHARDIFGPAAARLATGARPEDLGERYRNYERFDVPHSRQDKGRLYGEIVYIDHFGNCITNLQNDHQISELRVAGHRIGIKQTYSDGKVSELICVKGSIGYYEVAVNQGSARDLLQALIGMSVEASCYRTNS
jgi:S-adenosylmethionine hydrolase